MPRYNPRRSFLQREAKRADQELCITRGALVAAIRAGLSSKTFCHLLGPYRIDAAVRGIVANVEELSADAPYSG